MEEDSTVLNNGKFQLECFTAPDSLLISFFWIDLLDFINEIINLSNYFLSGLKSLFAIPLLLKKIFCNLYIYRFLL